MSKLIREALDHRLDLFSDMELAILTRSLKARNTHTREWSTLVQQLEQEVMKRVGVEPEDYVYLWWFADDCSELQEWALPRNALVMSVGKVDTASAQLNAIIRVSRQDALEHMNQVEEDFLEMCCKLPCHVLSPLHEFRAETAVWVCQTCGGVICAGRMYEPGTWEAVDEPG